MRRLDELAGQLRGIAAELEQMGAPPPPPAAELVLSTRLRMSEAHYFSESQEKDLIVLHFTAGTTASGAVAHWQSLAERIGTAYVIDVDGVIYEVFDPHGWAYHLGIVSQPSAPGSSLRIGSRHDRRSIGIELVNVGPLKRRGDDLCWWLNSWQARYCTIRDERRFVGSAFRGEQYFATFTDAQYASLRPLVRRLSHEHHIPLVAPPPDVRAVSLPSGFYSEFRGVCSHQNFRADKWDIGPAFDWDRLL